MKRQGWFFAGILGALVLAWGCSGSREVRVGVAGPLSGAEEATGKAILQGAQLAADEVNAAGGVRGRKVVVLPEDDRDDPGCAEDAAASLVRRRVAFVVGHVDSGCSLRAADTYRKHKTIMISAASTTPSLTDSGNENIFRVCGRDDRQGRVAATWVVNHMPGHSVAVVHDGTPYGRGLAEKFTESYEFVSGQTVCFEMTVPRGSNEFSALLAKAREVHPQLLYFGGLATQGAQLLKAVRAAALPMGFISGDGCFGAPFIRDAGADIAAGAMVTWVHDLSGRPAYREWLERYRAQYGDPNPYAVFGYTAMKVGLQAYGEAVYPVTMTNMKASLHRQKFNTLFGPLTFGDKGDPNENPFVIWMAVDGKWEEME